MRRAEWEGGGGEGGGDGGGGDGGGDGGGGEGGAGGDGGGVVGRAYGCRRVGFHHTKTRQVQLYYSTTWRSSRATAPPTHQMSQVCRALDPKLPSAVFHARLSSADSRAVSLALFGRIHCFDLCVYAVLQQEKCRASQRTSLAASNASRPLSRARNTARRRECTRQPSSLVSVAINAVLRVEQSSCK